jgi:hypothetical protein
MYQFKTNLLEAFKFEWRRYRDSLGSATKKGIFLQGQRPKDEEGLSIYDQPHTKTTASSMRILGNRMLNRERPVTNTEIVPAKMYPLEPDDDYMRDTTKPPIKTALLRLPKRKK